MRPEPGTEERPDPLDGVGMDFAKAIPVFIAGVFGLAMADGLVRKSPRFQTGIDVVFIGIRRAAFGDEPFDDGLYGRLSDVFA